MELEKAKKTTGVELNWRYQQKLTIQINQTNVIFFASR